MFYYYFSFLLSPACHLLFFAYLARKRLLVRFPRLRQENRKTFGNPWHPSPFLHRLPVFLQSDSNLLQGCCCWLPASAAPPAPRHGPWPSACLAALFHLRTGCFSPTERSVGTETQTQSPKAQRPPPAALPLFLLDATMAALTADGSIRACGYYSEYSWGRAGNRRL